MFSRIIIAMIFVWSHFTIANANALVEDIKFIPTKGMVACYKKVEFREAVYKEIARTDAGFATIYEVINKYKEKQKRANNPLPGIEEREYATKLRFFDSNETAPGIDMVTWQVTGYNFGREIFTQNYNVEIDFGKCQVKEAAVIIEYTEESIEQLSGLVDQLNQAITDFRTTVYPNKGEEDKPKEEPKGNTKGLTGFKVNTDSKEFKLLDYRFHENCMKLLGTNSVFKDMAQANIANHLNDSLKFSKELSEATQYRTYTRTTTYYSKNNFRGMTFNPYKSYVGGEIPNQFKALYFLAYNIDGKTYYVPQPAIVDSENRCDPDSEIEPKNLASLKELTFCSVKSDMSEAPRCPLPYVKIDRKAEVMILPKAANAAEKMPYNISCYKKAIKSFAKGVTQFLLPEMTLTPEQEKQGVKVLEVKQLAVVTKGSQVIPIIKVALQTPIDVKYEIIRIKYDPKRHTCCIGQKKGVKKDSENYYSLIDDLF